MTLRRLATAGCALLLITACAAESSTATEEPVVATAAGDLRGRLNAEGHRQFTAVPYAQPPVGALRWQPPRPALPWNGIRDATRPTPGCLQPPGETSATDLGEDCLYLNVTAPARVDSDHPAPVLVWIHGGGGYSGAGADYTPRQFVSRGVVVVTINYRLGAFGFFAHPAFADSGGNLGLQDQALALRWVRDNIADFGGDAANVTVAGESYGGFSVCAHLTMPASRDLFDRAIIQSGSCATRWPAGSLFASSPPFAPYRSRTANEPVAVQAAIDLGCPDPATAAECLRAVPAGQVRQLWPNFTTITYETPTVPTNPIDALQAGAFTHVPVLIGEVANGHSRWIAAMETEGPPITAASYRAALETAFGDNATTVASSYPLDAYQAPAAALSAVFSDHSWTCATHTAAAAPSTRIPVYTYEFDDPTTPAPIPYPATLPTGSAHGAELTYLFDISPAPGPVAPASTPLASAMADYWTRFLRTGDPNDPALPAWPRTTPDHPQTLRLAPAAITTIDLAATRHCDLWR
ncbi:carboxylesterase family protein [Nocardia sp. 2]|uniref:Carboxylesterase family protein n=1 Tax=Nocardia acididurans TaxID=2802282 RepID=A0ABS1MEV4_9NOCA|nr:carboxylesterase family protein [Nocardia acididurans]MBL1079158.1 carboxylesterase family protein [Nocardia acididurans]